MADRREATSLPTLLVKASSVAGGRQWQDLSFRPALELLLHSCAATGDLNPQGRRVLESVVVRHLVNRLLIEAEVARRPQVASTVEDPVIVVTGLPRTGTTLLHNLLALDPAWRTLRFWEALRPVPPEPARGLSEAELIRRATIWLERLHELVPGFRSIHASTAEGPEECDALLQNDFASQHLDDMFNAEEYSDWLASAPLGRQYRSYARQLNLLRRPEEVGRLWVLKSPGHLGHLDALLDALPAATVVHCHRPPGEAVASYASLVLCLRRAYSDGGSAAAVGRQALRRCRTALERAEAVRRRAPGRFVDVGYADLLHRPLASVAALYRRLGRSLPAEVAASMTDWLLRHPQHLHGVHRYASDDFGIAPADVAAAFGSYLDAPHPGLV